MKRIIFLLFVFFSIHSQVHAQAYVKFSKAPKMKLNLAKVYFGYKISYKAIKKSTIYLELKCGDQLVGTSVHSVNKPGTNIVSLPIKIITPLKSLKLNKNYSYNLYMYEGGRNDWSRKACKTQIINGVSMFDNPKRKPSLINTFN